MVDAEGEDPEGIIDRLAAMVGLPPPVRDAVVGAS
jgi:hypothetical protein